MEAALVELALDSESRIITYGKIAEFLEVEEADVELIVLKAMDAGAINGRVDAECRHLVIDATRKPEVSSEKVRQAALKLDQFESELTAELSMRKRSRNVFDAHSV